MDPILSILLGLLTNGLTAFIAQFARRDSKLILGKDLHKKIKWEQTALEPTLQRAINTLVENLEWKGTPSLEIVCLYLSSPEAEAITRQIYATQLSDSTTKTNWVSIEKELLASFHLFTTAYASYSDLRESELAETAKLLMETLIRGCEQTLNIAIDAGILAAHEAKSAFRYHMLLEELAVLQENIALLASQQQPTIQAILDFERKYRQQVGERHRYIIPPNFDKVRKLPIDDLYVRPKIVPYKQAEVLEKPTEVTMPTFLSGIYRAVLLGSPGGGKSTFTHKLCYDLTIHYLERIFAERKELTPILVVLREYGARKKEQNCSILEFIQLKAHSDYQVTPPPNAFEYLLLNGRAIVIFDGLDELLDTHYRQEISSDVDSFCTLYPSVPVLVTSREIGYEQAPLDEERFEVFRLAPFDQEQVREYAKKWFSTALDLTPEQQQQKAEAFLNESQSIPDLRSNPLMLALLCNIYREENYIPKNRPDVYEKCATMLFERWDKSRGIQFALPFEAHVRPTMMYLACWIYTDEGLRGGVTQESLVKKTTEYLRQRLFEDYYEAEKAAQAFIEFCEGRAWVFTDTGTTKEGEKLYQFTHQTFLEYFTASYLVRTHSTPASLMNVLRPRILKKEWDVVAQLAIHVQNKYVEGAGDKVLTTLIEQTRKVKEDSIWNLLSFTVRCLEFIVPSPRTVHSIASSYMEHFIIWCLARLQEGTFPYDKDSIDRDRTFISLLNTAVENRRTVATYLEKLLVELIKGSDEHAAVIASELGLTLAMLSDRHNTRRNETRTFWEAVSKHISDACSDQIAALRSKYVQIYYSFGTRNVADLVKWHGIEYLFKACPFIASQGSSWISIAGSIFNQLPEYSNIDNDSSLLDNLKEIGSILPSYQPPWIIFDEDTLFFPLWEREKDSNLLKLQNLDSATLFGSFILLAISIETYNVINSEKKDRFSQKIKEFQYALSDYINWIPLAYENPLMTDKVQEEMDTCGFTLEQQDFVWRWVHKELILVQQKVSVTADKIGNPENGGKYS